jgi:predicted SprT family Zn-dependent metalloprotease
MKYVVKYQNFNESKGISDSCENVLYKIWEQIEDDILLKKENIISVNIDEDDFKVKDLKLKYSITNSDDKTCYGITDVKNSEIEENHLTSSKIELNISIDEFDDEFIYYIKSVLLHELLHLFQHYNVLKGNKFRPESFSIGSILQQLRKNVNTKYAEYFLDILYYSLPHELSAQLHQYYLYKINDREYKKIEQILNLLRNFKIKTLSTDEDKDILFIKKHILNSIKFYTDNKNYLSDINKSLWNISDNSLFLNEFEKLINKRIKWVDKKISLINNKLISKNEIKYETIFLPSNWDDHNYSDIIDTYKFIIGNLNDCPK